MAVSIRRQCPHCQTSFLAQRGDKFFCQHSCTLAFNYWLRSRHSGAKRTPQLIETYRQRQAA